MEDNGKTLYVRSQEQFENPDAFELIKEDEFPHRSSMLDINRRDLLKFAGGTLAMAGLAQGCRYLPQQKIVPFVQAPEDRQPGHESVYATAASIGGFATGLLVRQYEGRPSKLEGNPGHPSSLGGISPQIQAELAVMFDPDRIRDVRFGGDVATWNEFFKVSRESFSNKAGGVAILSQNVNSPTLAAQISTFLKKNPNARWFQYEPSNRDNAHEGSKMAFGQPVDVVYHFDKADVIVTLDSDFFQNAPGHLAYSRKAMQRRDVAKGQTTMNRIYSFESFPTLVGAIADHRFRVKATQIQSVAMSLAAALGVEGATVAQNSGVSAKVIQGLAADLNSASGRAVVIAGEHQPPQVHALVHAINHSLGAFGNTLEIIEPVAEQPVNNTADLRALVAAMKEGQVAYLLILGGNPVWEAPADLNFAEALAKVKTSAHLSLYDNETSRICTYQLAESHFLEAWGDARGHDGTATVVQPLISPIFETMSAIEVLEHLNNKMRPEMDIVKATWMSSTGVSPGLGTGFEDEWNQWLSTGIISNSAKAKLSIAPVPNLAAAISAPKTSDIELVVLPDSTIHDGRYANIGWMQELPKPLTNITWDNAFHMSPATAKKLGVGQETQKLGVQYYGNWDIVRVTANGKTVEGPVYIFNGMADDVILVHTGYGREIENLTVAKMGDSIRVGGGFNAYPLRTADNSWITIGATVEKTGNSYKLANTQFHNLLDVTEVDSKRDIIRETTLAEYIKHENVLQHPTTETVEKEGEEPGTISLFPGTEGYNSPDQYQWAMTIDLNLCTGCGSCVTACQAENNIPTVGKEQTLRHRMLHWIRVDRYYRAEQGKAFDENNPVITFQPVTCMHCEQAPCEPVCPVAATTHSHEGINQMVYNRCVGTRYCSNNCPYKVRRFNYLHYTKKVEDVPVLKLLQNPDVTVRGRGVMEKCTYCVHRINHARIEAKKADREIKDGSLVTACQQACPTAAIVFGDMRRPQNAVSKTRASNRNYTLLKNLNTRPRTTYLGKVKNPNPEMGA